MDFPQTETDIIKVVVEAELMELSSDTTDDPQLYKQLERISKRLQSVRPRIYEAELLHIKRCAKDYADEMWSGFMESRMDHGDVASLFLSNYVAAKVLLTRIEERVLSSKN